LPGIDVVAPKAYYARFSILENIMIGPLVNSICIILGSISGSLSGQNITPAFRTKLMYVFSCITLGIGVSMTAKGNSLPPVVISLLFGTLLGEALHVESSIMRLACWIAGFFRSRKPQNSDLPNQVFRDQFAVATVLFCFSGLGIMGSMREGMTGDPSLLFIKALLDLPTAMLFASSIGAVVGILAVSQFLGQAIILLLASAVVPLTSPAMLADFSACGGIIMLGTGLRQCSLLEVPILSMLPSLFLVMPISALWARLFTF
jgi:uncharacterized protein